MARHRPPEPLNPDVTSATQPPLDERNPVGDACRHTVRSEPAHANVSGLDRGAQASYRGNPPGQHWLRGSGRGVAGTPGTSGSRRFEMPSGSIRVVGIATAPMSTTEYEAAVEALAVLLSVHGHSDPPAEAA